MTEARYLVALTAHARRVPSGPREAFADVAREAATGRGGVLVRTCHRAELYLPAASANGGLPVLPPGCETFVDDAAVRHVLAVATGADSVIVSEDQVLAQLRETLAEAHARTRLDPLIERLFQEALAAGRRARAWRQRPPRSLADVALDRIEERAGGLSGRLVAVVGAGTMGRLTATAARKRGARLTIASRTAANAAELAGRVGGSVVGFDAPLDPETVGAVVAVGGRWRVTKIPPALRTLVDLSAPPALPPEDSARLGERHVSADELALIPESEPERRLRRRLEVLIDEGTASFVRWMRARAAVPAILAVQESAEARRAREVSALLRRLPELEPNERALIERMSQRLVAGILHEPLSRLRQDEDGERARAARALFGL